MISNQEHVARIIFEPKMIHNGNLLVQAFDLRSHLHEDYISVLRMAIEGWQTDMMRIPTRKIVHYATYIGQFQRFLHERFISWYFLTTASL